MAYIVFDFDGTLADMKALLIEVGNEIAAKRGWQPVDEVIFDELSRGNMREGLKRLGIPLRDVPFLLLEGKRKLTLHTQDINLFPGIHELIESLHAAGHELFVLSTNSRKLIQTVLQQQGLADKLTVLPSTSFFGKAPALKRFMRVHKVHKQDMWMIGDELRDIEAAKRAGINSIAVSWGLQHPDTLQAAKPTFMAAAPKDIQTYISSLA